MKNIIGLLSGIIFGFGLALSGMTDTAKVLGFLDLFGKWVPDLIFVMGGAVLVTLLGFYLILKRTSPVFAENFHLAKSNVIDQQLLTGAALFGIGWGLYGYCPGPAISALVYFELNTLVFVVSMLIGMWLMNLFKT